MQKAWLLIFLVLPFAFASVARSDTTWYDPQDLTVVQIDAQTLALTANGQTIFQASVLDILQINLAVASALSVGKKVGIEDGARLLRVGDYAAGQFPIDVRHIVREVDGGILRFWFKKERTTLLLHENIPFVFKTQFQLDYQLALKYHRSRGFLEVIVGGDSYNPEVNFVSDERMKELAPHIPITPTFYTQAQLQDRNQLPLAKLVKEFARIAAEIVSL